MAYTYTEAEFAKIKELHLNGQTPDEIQVLFPDKSVASIRMKLVKAGVYTKTAKPATKLEATIEFKEAKFSLPTTKAGIRAAFKAAHDAVGDALF